MEITAKKSNIVLAILIGLAVLLVGVVAVLGENLAVQAEEAEADVSLRLDGLIAIAAESCDATDPDYKTKVKMTVLPGTQSSQCQFVTVQTNAQAGYSLTMEAASGDLAHVPVMTPQYVIPSTTTALSAGSYAALTNDRWGFAVPKTQPGLTDSYGSGHTASDKLAGVYNPSVSKFDPTYAIESDAATSVAKYAAVPVAASSASDKTIADTQSIGFTGTVDTYKLYFATKVTTAKPSGTYSGSITYTAIAYPDPCPYNPSLTLDDEACVEPPSAPTMQEFTTAKCAAMEIYTNDDDDDKLITLTDTRNGQDYLVGKLDDGNCWMLTNLKLGSTTSAVPLTPQDTNIPANWTLPQIDNTATGYYVSTPHVYALVSGQSGFSTNSPNSTETDIASEKFAGYYYNWCAATAGDPGTCTEHSVTPSDATRDICPANWRLPTSGFNGDEDFPNLYDAYGGSRSAFLHDGPFRGVLAGRRDAGTWYVQYGDAVWWSSSRESDGSDYALQLVLVSSKVVPDYSYDRYVGFSVRCLLD